MLIRFLITEVDYVSFINYVNTSDRILIEINRRNLIYQFALYILLIVIAFLTKNLVFGLFVFTVLVLFSIKVILHHKKKLNKIIVQAQTNYSEKFNSEVIIELNHSWIIKEDIDGVIKLKTATINEIIELKNQFIFKTTDVYFIISKTEETNSVTFKNLISELIKNNQIQFIKNSSI